MGFKFLSGDFVAEYNNAINDLTNKQKQLDDEYSNILDNLLEKESKRLNEIIPIPFTVAIK